MNKKLKSILLLDDNLATNFFHKKIIEKSEAVEQILEFRSGTNAIKYLNQDGIELPELIFVDINMPIMDAWEFLEKLEKFDLIKEGNTRVILLSTSFSPSDKAKADNIPFIEEVLLKPLTTQSIVNTVNKLLSEKSVI